ncbi:hypothetical protein KKB58_00990 [Patescibacteria group bacterium]|nr:hypothetical protein [Patescibacteria group bacterium]
MDESKRLATSGQLSAVGFKIASTVTRVLGEGNFGFEEANHLILNNEKALEKLTEKFCEEIFGIKADQWVEEKRRIERFYKKFFNRTVDWLKISMPVKKEGMNRLEVIFSDITEDDVFNAYAKQFRKDSVWKYYNSITKAIREQQLRPEGDYVISHVGGDEPDILNKSYDDGINEGVKFMVPKEGLISAFRHRIETNKMYDVKGITRFAALDSDGSAMDMDRNSFGKFCISSSDRDDRDSGSGLRQVDF